VEKELGTPEKASELKVRAKNMGLEEKSIPRIINNEIVIRLDKTIILLFSHPFF